MSDAQILHMPGADEAPGNEVAVVDDPRSWSDQVGEAPEFLRHRALGQYDVDVFGFDPELNDTVLMALLRPLYKRWFRVEVRGIEHIPATGGALLVGNHAGTIGLDAAMVQLAILDEHPAHRHLRNLSAQLLFSLPFVGMLARKAGATLACSPDAERLLRDGELVGVWPEGYLGTGKPFSERYRLQRFGKGGFVSAALAAEVPIVPCSVVGSEEIYPMLGNARLLARLFGLPYFPITPTFPWLGVFGMVPLPSKWVIEFGEPIDTSELGRDAADDAMLVFEITDQVRETIQHNLYRMLVRRRGIFR
ncbi:MAG TPA: lysophospholipid acyltransferase family protein [Candidatus Nanopelagicales bacterium]